MSIILKDNCHRPLPLSRTWHECLLTLAKNIYSFFLNICCTLLEGFILNSFVKTEPKSTKNPLRYIEPSKKTSRTLYDLLC